MTGLQGFLENRGQWSADVRHRSWIGPEALYLATDAWTVERVTRCDRDGVSAVALRFVLEGSQSAGPMGLERLPGLHHFFRGEDPSQWVTEVPWFADVLYRDVVPGVDVRLYTKGAVFEYDVIVRPGGRVDDLIVRCDGADRLWINETGDLCAEVGGLVLTQPRPQTYAVDRAGQRRSHHAGFRMLDDRRFRFVVDGDVGEATVVIDPGLVWSTFFGGNTKAPGATWLGASINNMYVQGDGTVTITGCTGLADHPVTVGAYSTTYNGSFNDVYVARLAPSGDKLIYGTYLGGGGLSSESSYGLDVESDGSTLITGTTWAPGPFPVTPGALQINDTANNFSDIVFVTHLNPTGSALLFSAVFGGTGFDGGLAVRWTDSNGIVVKGYSGSMNFPTTAGAYDTTANSSFNLFVSRISHDGSALLSSTYFGGSNGEFGSSRNIEIDDDGGVIFWDTTLSTNVPVTPGAFLAVPANTPAGFLAKLSPDLSSLVFSTYLGPIVAGATFRDVKAVRHPYGWITVTGLGWGMTVTPNTVPSFNGSSDLWVANLAADGTKVHHAVLIGTPAGETAGGLGVDGAGNIVISGTVFNNSFPTTAGSFDPDGSLNTTNHVIVSKLNPTLTALLYSTYLGGTTEVTGGEASNGTGGSRVAVQANGDVTVASATSAIDFPVTPGAFMTGYPAYTPSIVTRFDMLPTGAERVGEPNAGCFGPPAIGVTKMPKAGTPDFGITCFNLPNSSLGLLGLSNALLTQSIKAAGAAFWLDPASLLLVPVVSHAPGVAQLTAPIAPQFAGFQAGVQFFFPDTCAGGGVAASAALKITVQP